MNALYSILAMTLQAAPAVAAPPVHATPPANWTDLADLPLLRPWDSMNTPALATFVRNEVSAGRCAASANEGGYSLKVEMVILVDPPGRVRRIVPRAIDCPTVEQYASGLVSQMARGNIAGRDLRGGTWYRTSLTFAWPA